ncbi:hypothetical protein FFLO_05114 [Filobasidium floriforme]|uniref:Nitroreductase domain-containing protein n=1 Tax=Filobasidium floriforme TaxID=5210 RepID=A0A8K0NLR9_9TREE|nr:Nitroreductase-like protein [Filobasidium floriforme]KAG7530342.1 hypothetical protein FFLO_05114 [Filobasidium floriforme]KAH8082390.1 Nitroreductase-like protein [Filobasidium floriforme]
MSAVSTSTTTDAFLDAVKARRSLYQLSKGGSVPDSRVEQIVKEAILHTPTSFNYQIGRAVVLFGAEHDKHWDIVRDVLKAVIGEEAYEKGSAGRIAGFKAAKGTVLIFDDEPTVRKQEADFPPYSEHFAPWASQSHGILAHIIWTALELEGLGANLQHYGNLVFKQVQDTFNVPETWKLGSQLVFGHPEGPAGEKQFKPIEERFRSLGSSSQ